MIADPYYLCHIVKANAEIETAIESLGSDERDDDDKRARLVEITRQIEALIRLEVGR